jgi:hypothetical protein
MSAGFLAPIHRLGLGGQNYIPIISPDSHLCATLAMYSLYDATTAANVYLSGDAVLTDLLDANIDTRDC